MTDSPLDVAAPIWVDERTLYASAYETDDYGGVRVTLGEEGLDGLTAPSPIEPVEGSDGVLLTQLSPDGRRLTILITHDQRAAWPGIFDLETSKAHRLEGRDGRPFNAMWPYVQWIDNRRYAFWDLNRNQLLIADADTGATRALEGLEGPAGTLFAHDGRTLIANSFRRESDIWLLTLAEP